MKEKYCGSFLSMSINGDVSDISPQLETADYKSLLASDFLGE